MLNYKEAHDYIDQLYYEYSDRIYQFIYLRVKDSSVAEDITQDTYVKAYEKIDTLYSKAKAKSWLYMIARNLMIDYVRRQKIIQFISLPLHLTRENRELPEQQLQQKENHSELFQALQQLDEKYQSVIYLRKIEELSVKETAQILKCSQGKVRIDLHRGLAELRTILDRKGVSLAHVE